MLWACKQCVHLRECLAGSSWAPYQAGASEQVIR
jgi:hypothetical protein